MNTEKNKRPTSGEFGRFPELWTVKPFSEVVADITGGNSKIKRGECLDSGVLPVIDQGADFIAGYVDDVSLQANIELPCILFGDHTKIFKWIDEPFVLGADGVKLLEPKGDLDKRYLYHYLRQVTLPGNAGYSRHFKFLKEAWIPLPPLPEQKRIAAILDGADEARRKRRENLTLYDDLIRSLFLKTFGDPVSNPLGWDMKPMGSCVKVQGGFAFKSSDYTSNGVRLVRITNVHKDNLSWPEDTVCVPEEYLDRYKDFSLREGDIVVALTRPIIKSINSVKVARAEKNDLPCLLNQRVGRFLVKDSDSLNEEYLLQYLYSDSFKREVEKLCSVALQPNMSTKQVEGIGMCIPPIGIQRNFAKQAKEINAQKAREQALYEQHDDLFNALLQRAFKGELGNVEY